MKCAGAYELPEDQEPHLRRAVRHEIITLIYILSVVILMGLVMGSSQAMRAAWVEDMLVLIPPTAFLIASRIRTWRPNDVFPYGFHRAVAIGFLISAVALMSFGVLLLYMAVSALVKQEHTTIGAIELFGVVIWQGWLMVAVLVYSGIGPVILGHLQLEPAKQLHDKVLHAGSQMLKADWLSSSEAIVGIIGIGLGWWWADAVAAGVISLDVLNDGWRNLKAVIGDLMDRAPETADLKQQDPLPEKVRHELEQLPWVRAVDLRMRENGHVLFGEVFIVPVDESDPLDRTEEAVRVGQAVNWRVNTLVVQLVKDLNGARQAGWERTGT